MIIFEGGHIVCPKSGFDGVGYVVVDDGLITACGLGVFNPSPLIEAEKVDCRGKYILPGFIDVLCESGEPDRPWLEGLSNLAQAARAGGFTQLIHGPNRTSAIDTPAMIGDLKARSETAKLSMAFLGAATKQNKGLALAEMGLMLDAGALAISDGYGAISDSLVLRRVMEYLEPFGIPFVLQPTELALEQGGFMHEGLISTQIGLHGIPEAAEIIGLTRAITLCRQTSCRVHLSHITTERGVALLQQAKEEGLPVTGGVPAVHLILTDQTIRDNHYSTSLKLRPPLRPERDRQALIDGVKDGIIDIVFSGHSPLSRAEKELEFAEAEFGASGIETAALASWSVLQDPKLLATAMSIKPAEVFSLEAGITLGNTANLVMLEELNNEVRFSRSYSKGTNDPLSGYPFAGRIWGTCQNGVFQMNA